MFKFMGAVWDRLWGREAAFNNTATVRVRQTSAGYFWDASPAGGGGTTLQPYVVTELFGTDEDNAYDYFGATPWSYQSNNVDGDQIIVAKNLTGRGPDSEVIDGQSIIYNQYYNDNQRYAYNQVSQASEFQSLHTRYIEYPGFPPEEVDANGNPTPYQTGQYPGLTIEQCFVFVTRTMGPTLFDGTGTPISYYEAGPDRKWVYSPSLNGG